MKSPPSLFSSQEGLTLVEILASIVLLSIIIIYLLSFFTQSTKVNKYSKNITDATYLAETQMEETYNWNKSLTTPSLANLATSIKSNGFKADPACSDCYGISRNGFYVVIRLKNVSESLGKAIVLVYKGDKMNAPEAQMEMLLSWK